MIKYGLILFYILHSAFYISSAQVLCTKCYNQNARVLTDTNNLVVNGGFENGCFTNGFFCPNSSLHNCDITDWTCTGGGVNTYAHVVGPGFSIVPEGAIAAYFGNYFSYACSATLYDTSCFNNIGCALTGIPSGYPVSAYPGYGDTSGVSLQQTINGLTTGGTYVLEFWAGGEGPDTTRRGLFAVDVGFGNIFLRDPATPAAVGVGTRFVIAFTATSSSHTIKFTNWGHIGYNNPIKFSELILDDVRLFPANPDEGICTTTVPRLSQNTITVSPNPATKLLNISVNSTLSSEIFLYDISSRKLMEEKFSKEISLNIERFTKGIYFYEIRTDSEFIRGKMEKN